jgi:hypothetical protein
MSQTEREKHAQERKKRLVKYFTEPPDPRDRTVARVFVLLGGIALVAAGTVGLRWGVPWGLAALFVAAVCTVIGVDGLLRYRKRYRKAYPRPADQEMDGLLAAELVRIRTVSLEKLGVTADDLELTGEGWDPVAALERGGPVLAPVERRPLVVFGPAETAREEFGRDQVWRFSAYRVMAICPTQFNLGLYLCTVDLLTGALSHEQTREYSYDDVVAITTATIGDPEPAREVTLRDEDVHFARALLRELQIVTSGGDTPRIAVAVPVHDGRVQANLQASGIELVIASVRRVLRDRTQLGSLERI